jgi:hypothetical protein
MASTVSTVSAKMAVPTGTSRSVVSSSKSISNTAAFAPAIRTHATRKSTTVVSNLGNCLHHNASDRNLVERWRTLKEDALFCTYKSFDLHLNVELAAFGDKKEV